MCAEWVHQKCSGSRGSVTSVAATFKCKVCTEGAADGGNVELDLGDGVKLEGVKTFCYLGDMLNGEGGSDSATVARVLILNLHFILREVFPALLREVKNRNNERDTCGFTHFILTRLAHLQHRSVRLGCAKATGIPQVAILTHCEIVCPEVGKDVTNVYKSRHIKEKIVEVKQKLGIPLNDVFAVKNYATEVETDTNMDILLLYTFKHMINYAGDFIENTTIKEEEEED
uniref:uncharacterized protein isoform X3 n=1 Tax=Myxine glutinosa TaxID=7769 RepID=UPI00358FF175